MTRASEGRLLPSDVATPHEIRDQLSRIMDSGRFAAAGRLRDLLKYIVDQHLDGRGASLKESVIGTELFGKPPGYDTQSTSVVRTTAQRLRAELAEYYAAEGANDELIITLPKGHYQPQFTFRGAKISARIDPTTAAHAQPPLRSTWKARAVLFSVVALSGFIALFLAARHRNAIVTRNEIRLTPKIGRLFAYSTSEYRSPVHLHLGYQAGPLIVTPDGRILYAIEWYGRAVTILGVDDLEVKKKFQLPHVARAAVISNDGKHLYIGSPDSVVMVVNVEHGSVERLIPTGRPVFDLSVTPDEKKIYIALGSAGLKRMSMPAGEITTLSEFACPLYLEMSHDGNLLFVSYQCGGPGGRAGHDVVEIYDTKSEQVVRVIRDLPLVGGQIRVSPDGTLLLLDGLDACVTKAYDHVGCPDGGASHVFHLIRISDGSVLKSFGRPTNAHDAVFSPDGGRLVFGGDPLVVMDWARQMVTEVAPIQGRMYNFVAFPPTGGSTFAASFQSGDDILVFETQKRECGEPPEAFANLYSGDGTFDDGAGVSALTPNGNVKFAPGLNGQAFQFTGTGSFLDGGGGAGCWPCKNNWTESFFVKFNSIDGEITLLEREDRPDSHWSHRIFKTKDNHLVLQIGPPSDRLSISSSAFVEAEKWYHVAVVAGDTSRDLYVNGAAQGHENVVGSDPEPSNRGALAIGASRGKRNSFSGLIDEIAWYERALAPGEVMSLSQSRWPATCRP